MVTFFAVAPGGKSDVPSFGTASTRKIESSTTRRFPISDHLKS